MSTTGSIKNICGLPSHRTLKSTVPPENRVPLKSTSAERWRNRADPVLTK
jgi:hypothetical protein